MGNVRLNGSSSGYVELVPPANAGSTSINLPNSSVDLSNSFSAWTSYTPTIRTQSGTVTIGNGSITGAYKLIGKTCFFRLKFTIGSTTSISANAIIYGLPVAAASLDYNFPVAMLDNGVSWYGAMGVGNWLGSTTEFAVICKDSTGLTWSGHTNTVPLSLLNGDYVSISGSYEAA